MLRARHALFIVGPVFLVLGCAIFVAGCASSVENRDPSGELFPSVEGEALTGESVQIPEAFTGRPLLILVGYEQDAQFDADRWLVGLLQAQVQVEIREVPTIDGFVPGILSSRIDEGMRKGIPSEDWASVVTVYDDASRIVEFTGNENGNNIRVLLLDGNGRVRWFHDRGFSAGKLLELQGVVESLRS
ncbi:MAG: hypothetical protein KDB53_04505 [Planctomycetes bacterium]|nr:hypothetical protein [Planctomycetota bacterium]